MKNPFKDPRRHRRFWIPTAAVGAVYVWMQHVPRPMTSLMVTMAVVATPPLCYLLYRYWQWMSENPLDPKATKIDWEIVGIISATFAVACLFVIGLSVVAPKLTMVYPELIKP